MKKLFFVLIFLMTGFLACDKNKVDEYFPCIDCKDITKVTKEEGQAYLNAWYKKLIDVADKETCSNPNDFKMVPIGSKACGGPTGYVAFKNTTNNQVFFTETENYSKAQEEFNKKWGIVSDCSIVNPPKGIECVAGKPKFNY